MIRILFENDSDVNLEFHINLYLDLKLIIQSNLFYLEDVDQFHKDNFQGIFGLTDSELDMFYDKLHNTVDNFVLTQIKDIAKDFGLFVHENSRVGSVTPLYDDPNSASFACYYQIQANTQQLNLSENMDKKLSTFKIRVANHINEQELKGITNLNNIKIFHQYLPDMYKSDLCKYTYNIFNAYQNFLDSLYAYDNQINSFKDIKESDIFKVKRFTVQGNFPGYPR